MRILRFTVVLLVVLIGVSIITKALLRQLGTDADPSVLSPFTLEKRPRANHYLFDYANILTHYQEGAHQYLRRISGEFHIESVIVSLPDMRSHISIEELAVDIVNGWDIGKDQEGRGLLLLLVNEESQVKLEVGYELEDVFTDTFTGYIEDLQLRPYYLRGDIGTGLIAVMEEIERRAQIKHQDEYTPGMITELDRELLAGGGGATRRLASYQDNRQTSTAFSTDGRSPGAASPDEAWRTMLTKWSGKGVDIEADIYTEMTKLAMGDQNNPDNRTKAALGHWQNADYQVLQDDDHAAIYFGNIKGWNNAPFLFCNTAQGWKFDIVHQRRLVVMASNPHWMVEQGNYPYVELLSDVRQSTGKDLPLEGEDLYSCERDEEIAERIATLERIYRDNPDEYQVVMELARLNVITGRRANHIHPLLEKAKTLNQNAAEPYKYSAIYNVNSFFQYETALQDIEIYVDKRPDDAFGHSFIGFLHYRLGNYDESIIASSKAVEFNPDNAYAYSLMARDYALLYQNAGALDPRKSGYKNLALDMYRKAETVATPDYNRISWLRAWLKRRDIL